MFELSKSAIPLFYRKRTYADGSCDEISIGPCAPSLLVYLIVGMIAANLIVTNADPAALPVLIKALLKIF
jgi:hypothetical protein